MARFIVVVLDGFGVGEMPDVPQVRPQDRGANTASKLLAHFQLKRLPTLEKLGLQNIVQCAESVMQTNPSANIGRALLAHQGGDTFMGHQEIMGTRPKPPLTQPFQHAMETVETALLDAGYRVERVTRQGLSLLSVNEGVLIGDNLEAELGQVYNLTCNFNVVPFETLLAIAAVVRQANPVGRNIAFGGNIDGMQRVLNAIELKPDSTGIPQYIGVNSPDSGAYDEGFRVVHLGYGVDANTQVPKRLHDVGIKTWLYGKVADIVQNPHGISYTSVVDTDEVFRLLHQDLQSQSRGFFCANIQETDLSGHQQDPKRYWQVLEKSDKGIAEVIALMDPEDLLVVMADHGNDPFIGHTKHTREQVPLMIYQHGLSGLNIGERATMSDVGATVTAFFGAEQPEHGEPIEALLKRV
ncbi:phosphopentomutase [Thaumasiovibrio subtropicus]|uniref:phosphopentomutase n=1 Tax=Thaumasiovibrio subtropicus TaxID=1891207 RepID=UPI000B3531FD|nr:phosphopentomutase [Thaumasiovibrio subtropicus]